MRTVKDPDVRKQEILECAIKIFATKGYDKTTTADIATELHISQGLCYRYFPTKEAIYDAALEKYADEIAMKNLKKVNLNVSIKDLINGITNRMDDMKATEKEDESLYLFFHSENARRMHDELFLKVAKKIVPHVQQNLKRAKENGEIHIQDTDSAAIMGIYGWIGLYMTDGLTDKERNEKIRKMWFSLLGLN